jgi:SulP family sulfate permease
LIAQGVANIFSSIFGGIPATGAIARTATNIRNGGKTPIAGITHAIVLLLIMLFVGKWAALIPLSCLAGILVVVAYNMSEWENFLSILKNSWNDRAVLITTFLLTVLIDLTVAIEIGIVLAAFLFLRQMIQTSNVSILSSPDNTDVYASTDSDAISNAIPKHVEVFEITGPLFFGAAYKFKDALRQVERSPKILIIRMRHVPVIDATGIRALKEVQKDFKHRGTELILSEVTNPEILKALNDSRLLFTIGKANVTDSFEAAIRRCNEIL